MSRDLRSRNTQMYHANPSTEWAPSQRMFLVNPHAEMPAQPQVFFADPSIGWYPQHQVAHGTLKAEELSDEERHTKTIGGLTKEKLLTFNSRSAWTDNEKTHILRFGLLRGFNNRNLPTAKDTLELLEGFDIPYALLGEVATGYLLDKLLALIKDLLCVKNLRGLMKERYSHKEGSFEVYDISISLLLLERAEQDDFSIRKIKDESIVNDHYATNQGHVPIIVKTGIRPSQWKDDTIAKLAKLGMFGKSMTLPAGIDTAQPVVSAYQPATTSTVIPTPRAPSAYQPILQPAPVAESPYFAQLPHTPPPTPATASSSMRARTDETPAANRDACAPPTPPTPTPNSRGPSYPPVRHLAAPAAIPNIFPVDSYTTSRASVSIKTESHGPDSPPSNVPARNTSHASQNTQAQQSDYPILSGEMVAAMRSAGATELGIATCAATKQEKFAKFLRYLEQLAIDCIVHSGAHAPKKKLAAAWDWNGGSAAPVEGKDYANLPLFNEVDGFGEQKECFRKGQQGAMH